MIRASCTALLALSTASCSWLPGLDFPELTFKPQYYLLELRGETRMQSAPGGPPPTDNPFMRVQDLGLTKRDDDYGGTLRYGDGFSGIEASYLNVDIDTTDRGVLSADWGTLPAGTIVTAKFELEEYGLRYIGRIFDYETDEQLRLRAGLGVAFAHRDGQLNLTEEGGARSQLAEFSDDGLPFLAGRLRADYRGFSIIGNYAYTNTTFGGDFETPIEDYSIDLAYALEDQDIRFFAGYRWIELPISGAQDGFGFDADLTLEGFVLGAELTF